MITKNPMQLKALIKKMASEWKKYQYEFDYAKDISFDETCSSILKILILASN